MQFFYLTILATFATSACAWEVTAYGNVEDCAAASDTTYRIFDGLEDSLGVCQGVAGAASPSITCAEYTNGGFEGPNNCDDRGEDGFYAKSVHLNDTTGSIPSGSVFCQFYASAGCSNDDQSPQIQCFNPFGLGAVSFMCVEQDGPA